MVLMLSLILSGAFCHASGVAGTENGKESDGVPIDLKESTGLSGLDKSNSIIATLNYNVLIVVFTDNLGEVDVEITSATGNPISTIFKKSMFLTKNLA